MYDAIVAGGSISGLLAAREIAKGGNSVLVLEEGFEVGSPEHCGGLVSKSALNDLGIKPSVKSFDSRINSAKVFSPNGNYFAIDSTLQQIIVVNRRELDKQAALQAKQYGAEIIVKASFKNRINNKVETSIGNFEIGRVQGIEWPTGDHLQIFQTGIRKRVPGQRRRFRRVRNAANWPGVAAGHPGMPVRYRDDVCD